MRIWSLHPRHLDRVGLVAAWREALLAQAVLAERTKGYRHHPQLLRFRGASEPLGAIRAYLSVLHSEATARGYGFDETKILAGETSQSTIPVTQGQLDYEWSHLGAKLTRRSPDDAQRWRDSSPTLHPLFEAVPGDIESWERP